MKSFFDKKHDPDKLYIFTFNKKMSNKFHLFWYRFFIFDACSWH